MNQEDRKLLQEQLTTLEMTKGELEGLKDDLENRIGNMEGTNLGSSPVAEKLQEEVDALDEAIGELESAIDSLSNME